MSKRIQAKDYQYADAIFAAMHVLLRSQNAGEISRDKPVRIVNSLGESIIFFPNRHIENMFVHGCSAQSNDESEELSRDLRELDRLRGK